MIKELPDGTIQIYYKDWTNLMLALSRRYQALPHRHPWHPKLHDLGIEHLAKLKGGQGMIRQLNAYSDELTERPTDKEVIRMGKNMYRMCHIIKHLQFEHRRLSRKQFLAARGLMLLGTHSPADRSFLY